MRFSSVALVWIFCASLAAFGSAAAEPQVIEGHFRSRPPEMVVAEDGQLSGPLKDILDEAAAQTGATVAWRIVPFATSLADLRKHSPIVVPRVRRTFEREEFIDFLGPISLQKRMVRFIVAKSRGKIIESYDDLKGMTVATLGTSATFERFDADATLKKSEFADDVGRARALQSGLVDAVVASDLLAFETALKGIDDRDWAVADYRVVIRSGNYFAVAKDGPLADRSAALDKAVRAMVVDGRVQAIYQKYNLSPDEIGE